MSEEAIYTLYRYPSGELEEFEYVQELIRCKECKWYEQPSHKIYENCVRWKNTNGILLPIKPDDFCSYGERESE